MKDELKKLQITISGVKAILLEAEERRANNQQIRDWLEKLQDAVYDADALLDQFHTEILWRKSMPAEYKMTTKVSTFFSNPKQFDFPLKMAHVIKAIRQTLDIRGTMPFYLLERLEETQVSC